MDAAGGQGPASDARGGLLDGPVGCLLGAMVRAAPRGKVALVGRAVGPRHGVVQVRVHRLGVAAGTITGRPAGTDQVVFRFRGYGGYPAGLGTVTHGLQFGIGDEGALKNQLIQGIVPPPAEKKQ